MTRVERRWYDFVVHYETQKLDLGPAQLIWSKMIGARTDAQIADQLDEYRRFLLAVRERRQKVVDILDIRSAAPPTAKQRRMQGNWNTEYEELMRQTLVGFGFVVSSTIMRGIITSITWLKPLPVPTAVFTDPEQAIQWGFERLSDSGFPITSADLDGARRVFGVEGSGNATVRR